MPPSAATSRTVRGSVGTDVPRWGKYSVMPPSGCDEDDLAASLSQSARFTPIFERHLAEIHRYLAYRVGSDLADDLAADTFLQAFGGRRNFVSSEGNVIAWLYGIATNLVRHHRRDEQRH